MSPIRRFALVRVAAVLFVAGAAVVAGTPDAALYKIRLDPQSRVQVTTREREGKPSLLITVRFTVRRAEDGTVATDVADDEIVVEEDHRRVKVLDVQRPATSEPLTTVLAVDISGSMAAHGKLDAAKRAARLFLDKLHRRSDCGLVLFDHRMHDPLPPVTDPRQFAEHRKLVRARIDAARPGGGTAYRDATALAIDMLRPVQHRKAVVLMTDGVDLNSNHTLVDVVKMAQATETPVYTLGVGEPGRQEPVTTVLVLDHSGSMQEPADDVSHTPKIVALRQAAERFTDLMRPGAATSLLPFSDEPDTPHPFRGDKTAVKKAIQLLQPGGETALFDAAYTAIEMLVAARRPGKEAVIVLTDGIDNRSRHRAEEVIEQAREAAIPLHMLGFGRAGELNEAVMKQMAAQTAGTYHHARNEQSLFQVFEDLSIDLHDDGIDEAELHRLAERTGGKYYAARDASRLSLLYGQVAEELQSSYSVTFLSRRQAADGTARGIDIRVVRGGVAVSDVAGAAYHVHGVVVPVMDVRVYLVLLVVLAGLLALPASIRWLQRYYSAVGR